MIDFSKLEFLPLDLPNPPDVIEKLDNIPVTDMLADKYRNCYHIPLMSANGNWLPLSDRVLEIVEWCEKYLFTWAKRSRLMVITTQPGAINPPHIDCSPNKFHTWQHKFRYVLRGRVDSLNFIHDEDVVTAPQIDKPFIMSGKWPHAMNNKYPKCKYTLALGAPWEPDEDDEDYIDILHRSYKIYKDYYLSFENKTLPKDYKSLYEAKYYV